MTSLMFLRYRQTPNTPNRVKAHAVGREHQLLPLCVVFFLNFGEFQEQECKLTLFVYMSFICFICS